MVVVVMAVVVNTNIRRRLVLTSNCNMCSRLKCNACGVTEVLASLAPSQYVGKKAVLAVGSRNLFSMHIRVHVHHMYIDTCMYGKLLHSNYWSEAAPPCALCLSI